MRRQQGVEHFAGAACSVGWFRQSTQLEYAFLLGCIALSYDSRHAQRWEPVCIRRITLIVLQWVFEITVRQEKNAPRTEVMQAKSSIKGASDSVAAVRTFEDSRTRTHLESAYKKTES